MAIRLRGKKIWLVLCLVNVAMAQATIGHARHRSSLYSSLVSFWRLEEASGTRNDSYGTNNLSDNNTVTQTTGKINNCALFTAANSEYLSIADNTSLSLGDVDFTATAWVYLSSKTNPMTILGKTGSTAATIEYAVSYSKASDRFVFTVRNTADNANTTATANTFGSPFTSTWYFIVVYHNSSTNFIGISVNNGAFDTAATSGGVKDGTNAFVIGANATPATYFDGRVDSVGFWKGKVLSSAEITNLYNNSIAVEFPF